MYLPNTGKLLFPKSSPITLAIAQAYVPSNPKFATTKENPRGVAPPMSFVRESRKAHMHLIAIGKIELFLISCTGMPRKKLRDFFSLFRSGLGLDKLISESSFHTRSKAF